MSGNRAKLSSAPSRISSRDDVWKDIRDWAKPSRRTDDDEEGDGGEQGQIIGSQIKDNITEQRLLESRLFDLSKERYKFMVHVAWQRKAFMDKQKSKTSVMKDLLRKVDVAEQTAGVQKGRNYRSGLTEKLDSYRDLVKKTYSEQRKVEMMIQETGPDEIKPIIPGIHDPLYKTEPTFSARSKRRGHGGHVDVGRRGPQNPTMFPAIQPPDKSRQQSVPPNFMRRGMSRVNSSNRLPETASRPGAASGNKPKVSVSAENLPRYLKYRSVYDGRFKGLERSLSATYDGKSGPSIDSILNGLPTRSMSVAL